MHSQTFFTLKVSCLFLPIKEQLQTRFYFVWCRSAQRGGLISLFVLSVLGFGCGSLSSRSCFHFVARLPSPLRGDCHLALCQAGAHTPTRTHTSRPRSVVDVSIKKNKKKTLLLSFPLVIMLRCSFLWADSKHVSARDSDGCISPVNICSLGLLCSSFQEAADTLSDTHAHTHTHLHCGVYMVDNQRQLVLSSVRTVRFSRGASKLQATGTWTNTHRAHLRPNAERHLSVTVGGFYC